MNIAARTRLGDLNLDIDITVAPGERLALIGPSGAGKSSVLRIAAGLLEPDHGRVTCGEDTWLDTDAGIDLPPERRGCGLVFQHYALFEHLTAEQNVAYGLRSLPRPERSARARELLARLGLADRAHAKPRTLSGGERQRVAVARALAPEPHALLLDEPLAALDARTRAHSLRELRSALDAAGGPVLIVTHDLSDAALLADRIAVLDRGRIVQTGTAAALATSPSSGLVAELTGTAVLSGTVSGHENGLTTVALDGGGTVVSTDHAEGPVAVTVPPWEVTLEPAGSHSAGSARNHLPARVVSVMPLGNRVRVGLALPEPLTAELTMASAGRLEVTPGAEVVAAWKATATRVIPR